MKNERESIRWFILKMDKPFVLSTLFEQLKVEQGVENRLLILEVLNSLLDCGLVKHSEMVDDLAIYQSSLTEPA